MTMINTPERGRYLRETSASARLFATRHPVAVWGSFAALWIVGGIVCGVVAAWWTALPAVAVGLAHLLPLWWNLRHRDEALRARQLRRGAVDAGFRRHPARAVVALVVTGFGYALVRLGLRHEAHGAWLFGWAGLAGLLGLAVGLWRLHRARRDTGPGG